MHLSFPVITSIKSYKRSNISVTFYDRSHTNLAHKKYIPYIVYKRITDFKSHYI